MNDKQNILHRIAEIVVGCCTFEVNGKPSLTLEAVLGKSRKTNLCMTRCILTHVIMSAGYSTETIGLLLGRSEAAVRDIIKQGHNYLDTSRAYRTAYTEAYRKCEEQDLV